MLVDSLRNFSWCMYMHVVIKTFLFIKSWGFFVRKPIGLIFVEKKITFFALIGESYAFICESFALFHESSALFRESFAFIREIFAFIRESYVLFREKNDFFLYENEPNRLSYFSVLEFLGTNSVR